MDPMDSETHDDERVASADATSDTPASETPQDTAPDNGADDPGPSPDAPDAPDAPNTSNSAEPVATSEAAGDDAPAESAEPEEPDEPGASVPGDAKASGGPADSDGRAERTGIDERELDALAVTAPLKSRRGAGNRAVTAQLEAAITGEPLRDPLAPGETLAGYTIGRLLRTGEDGPIYLATPAAPETAEEAETDEDDEGVSASATPMAEEEPPWRYVAREVAASDADRMERVVAAGARGPGLLAPVAFAREGGRAYVISVELPGQDGADADAPAAPLGGNERLRPVDALTACTQLAIALGALHRAELAHLRVSPGYVTLYDGRVYLGGVEQATPVSDPEEAKTLFARDANFLARTIATLGGAGDVALWDHDSSAQRSLREIAARGAAGTYTSVDEVAETSSLGLQMLMVAGARMGADVRAVRLRLDWGAASSVGRVRSENQDAWAATEFAVHDDAAADAPLGVFLVADGMGGEAHGEIASRFVARLVTAEMARRFFAPQSAWPALAVFTAAEDDATTAPQVPLTTALAQAVKEANQRTRAFGARINATTGSTVTALAVAGARAALAHLGDSRAYLLRDGNLLQLTEDHSLMARLEAMRHPLLEDPSFSVPRSVLYRSIGQEDDVEPDMLQFVLAPGDRLMMCSDGLWDEVPRELILQTLSLADDPHTCAGALVALANASGGHDNSTAVVIFVHAVPTDQPFEGATPDEIAEAAREATGEPDEGATDDDTPGSVGDAGA